MSTCPTPDKRRYTRMAAIAAAIRRSRAGTPLRVYRCPCGAFHLTSWPTRARAREDRP